MALTESTRFITVNLSQPRQCIINQLDQRWLRGEGSGLVVAPKDTIIAYPPDIMASAVLNSLIHCYG